MQSVLCILFIGITLALFWFGMTDWSGEPEPMEIESYLKNDAPRVESADANGSDPQASSPSSPQRKPENAPVHTANQRPGLFEKVFLFDVEATNQSERLLRLHLQALNGDAFLEALTDRVTSDKSDDVLLLSPFKESNLTPREILRALRAVSLLKEEDGSPALKVLTRGNTSEAAQRLSGLLREVYLSLLANDSSNPDSSLVDPKLAAELRRKEEQVQSLLEDVYREQRSKPASSIQIVQLRAELENAENRRNTLVLALEEVSRIHKEGGGVEQVASLPAISTKGRINDYLVPLAQLRRMYNSPKAANLDIREELERNISKNEELLRLELESVLSRLSSQVREAHVNRDMLLAKLTALEGQNSTISRNSLRFKALKHAEKELEQLQYRHSQAMTEWRKATRLLTYKPLP